MLDCIGENISFTFAVFLCVLLRGQDNRLSTIFTVDLIQHFVEFLHLLMTLRVIIDEVRLDAVVRDNTHDNNPSPLVMIALTEDPLRAVVCRLHNLLGVVGGREKSFLAHIPILGQILAEMVSVNEDADGLRY